MTDWIANIKGRATLAPMAGASDIVFRLLCREMGAAFAVTEMVSAKGYLMAGHRPAVRELVQLSPGERAAVQIFGREPDVMAEAARALTERYSYMTVDINMGCPAPKITGNGDGSALLLQPYLAEKIVRAVRDAVSVPVTVKMRIGWEAGKLCHVDFARRMRDAGAALLTVHGRTREQQYSGDADWEAIAQTVRAVDIPVVGNGDVKDAESFGRMLDATGCHAVAIGRAALGNPWIFAEIAAMIEGRASVPPDMRERISMCLRHAAMLCAVKGERAAIAQMRTHAAYYLRGMKDAAEIRRRVQMAATLEQLEQALS